MPGGKSRFFRPCSVSFSEVYRASRLPWKSFPPDFVITLMIPPIAFPYSASKPLVWIAISWIESNVKFEVNVCVTGSVVFSPSIRKEFWPRLDPKTDGFPPAPAWFATPGASRTTFW